MTSDDDKTSGDIKSRRIGRYKRAGLVALLVLLVAASVQAWLMLSVPKQREAAAESSAIRELERRVGALERRLEAVAAERPAVVPVASNVLWWIAETERYLMEAGERLESGAHVKTALPALKSARQTLAGTDVAGADPVKKTLDMEIRLLSKYRNEEAEQALATIDAALEQFKQGGATVAQDTAARGAKPAGSALQAGAWTRFTDALADRFKRLVVVEKEGTETQRVTQGAVVRSLVLARTAVLEGDSVSYRYAVANAMQALEQTGEVDDALYGELQVLYALDIAGAPPRIGKALAAVRALAAEVKP